MTVTLMANLSPILAILLVTSALTLEKSHSHVTRVEKLSLILEISLLSSHSHWRKAVLM